ISRPHPSDWCGFQSVTKNLAGSINNSKTVRGLAHQDGFVNLFGVHVRVLPAEHLRSALNFGLVEHVERRSGLAGLRLGLPDWGLLMECFADFGKPVSRLFPRGP